MEAEGGGPGRRGGAQKGAEVHGVAELELGALAVADAEAHVSAAKGGLGPAAHALGAALLQATALFGYVISFSFSGSGSMLPETAEQAVDLLSVLELVGSIARLVATAVGLVILMRGIGEVRQARRRAL